MSRSLKQRDAVGSQFPKNLFERWVAEALPDLVWQAKMRSDIDAVEAPPRPRRRDQVHGLSRTFECGFAIAFLGDVRDWKA